MDAKLKLGVQIFYKVISMQREEVSGLGSRNCQTVIQIWQSLCQPAENLGAQIIYWKKALVKSLSACITFLLSQELRLLWGGHDLHSRLRGTWRNSQMVLTNGQCVFSWSGNSSVYLCSLCHRCKELLNCNPEEGKTSIKMLWLWNSIWNWGISKTMRKYTNSGIVSIFCHLILVVFQCQCSFSTEESTRVSWTFWS